jgi:hypothetical protein
MLKAYLSKFTMDILPSVVATIIGAYVVNHYIVTKPGVGADAPAAAAVSSVDPKKAGPRNDAKNEAKSSEKSSDVANIPEPGVRAKGISEKAVFEKPPVEKPPEKAADKTEKPAGKPAETASIPAETRRHQPVSREKTVARTVPTPPPQPSAPVIVPAVAAPAAPPVTAPPVEAAIAPVPEERRDANDLARAAIERLRGTNEGSPRAQESARVPDAPRTSDTGRIPDAPRVASAPAVVAPPVRPLPPPIMVSTPSAETIDSRAGSSQMNQAPYGSVARIDDPRRPTPPADIPVTSSSRPPLDLQAAASEPSAPDEREHRDPREHTNVAEDMLSAAKSVFHAVLPK